MEAADCWGAKWQGTTLFADIELIIADLRIIIIVVVALIAARFGRVCPKNPVNKVVTD